AGTAPSLQGRTPARPGRPLASRRTHCRRAAAARRDQRPGRPPPFRAGVRGMLTIYVDADACPVKDEVYRVARRYQMRVVVVANAPLRVPADELIELV